MSIDRLLDFESQALFAIFTYLKENPGFHDINEISEQIGFEKRTTSKYLERLSVLSDEVKERAGTFPLTTSERNYQIIQTNYAANKELCLAIYHISIKIDLLEGLLLNKENTMNALMDKYSLSYSTLKKDVYEIRDFLKEATIDLHIRNGELVLSGLEPTIRLFFLSFFGSSMAAMVIHLIFKAPKKKTLFLRSLVSCFQIKSTLLQRFNMII